MSENWHMCFVFVYIFYSISTIFFPWFHGLWLIDTLSNPLSQSQLPHLLFNISLLNLIFSYIFITFCIVFFFLEAKSFFPCNQYCFIVLFWKRYFVFLPQDFRKREIWERGKFYIAAFSRAYMNELYFEHFIISLKDLLLLLPHVLKIVCRQAMSDI